LAALDNIPCKPLERFRDGAKWFQIGKGGAQKLVAAMS
jgi:hypothetical protein